MPLSAAVLEAIKNRDYNLKPVKLLGNTEKKRNDGFSSEIAEILARRISMGYAEESGKTEQESLVSIRSNGTITIYI